MPGISQDCSDRIPHAKRLVARDAAWRVVWTMPVTTAPPTIAAASLSPAPVGSRPEGRRDARLRLVDGALDMAWSKGWAERPTLDPEALIRKAASRTGCSSQGNGRGWRRRLALLSADLECEAALTPLGRTIAHGQLVAALSNRFRALALWRRHPEIARHPIRAPIIVLGQMRSGTTRMQRLLACDPRLAYTRFYESWNPLRLNARRGAFDDRKLRGWLGLFCARMLNPDFESIHPTRWNAADEEIGLQSVSIFGSAFEAQWRVPNYCAAVEADDGVEAYAEFRRLLQTIAWLRGDDGRRPWILKVPQFTQDIPALLNAFSDARIINLSRDRAQLIASASSLVRNQMSLQSEQVDPRWIGREWTRKVELREDRTRAALACTNAPRIDVAFDDVNRDWAGEMQRVYRLLGMTLPPPVLARMRAYSDRSGNGAHTRHAYDRRDFGL